MPRLTSRAMLATVFVAAALPAALSCSPGQAPSADAKHSSGASSPADALQFTGFVVDQAHILSQVESARLTAKLDRFQQATGHQLAVVTVSSLAGQDVGRFTTALANRWGVGRKGLNDGIVLLIAPNERQVRISVGYGLERSLPDALCAAIIQQRMLPAFREGEMAAGIEAGATAIIDRLDRKAVGAGSGNRTRVTSLEG